MKTPILSTIPLLVALVAPAAAQDAPPPRDGPPPEVVERLERVRMERMQRALDLSDREIARLRERMEAHRAEMRSARMEQGAAMERLRATLRDEPVDQREVTRAMEDVERERERIRALRDRLRETIGGSLTPEKRAKLMLFNEQFDRRLRELVAGHRAPGFHRPPCPPGETGR
ncbi:MAG: periplasmic heavy metal sensor [Gemmatimonadetes bacterium]|nr:periplasmic heavy metal sensor [Gemmatimonadota bacterium]